MSILVENIKKTYKTKNSVIHALHNINLEIHESEFVCIVGPSGCGKSTLLNIIAGLEKATEGKVYFNGNLIKTSCNDRTVIFQENALYPWLNVVQNVEFGMKMTGVSKYDRREKAIHYLKMMKLEKFQNSRIHELSGGMRQRVAIARAIALDSSVLLMDEPFSAIDIQTKHTLQNDLIDIWNKTKKTIIFITHNVEEAVFLADRIILMDSTPGQIRRIFNVNIKRPRVSINQAFIDLANEIYEDLKGQRKAK